MREIKFRFWEDNKMQHWEDFVCLDMCDWLNKEDVVAMQYTGLLDKNGVDCYENDLVKIKDKEFTVEWYKEYVGFRAISGKLCLNMYSNEFEIIGNIYENKR